MTRPMLLLFYRYYTLCYSDPYRRRLARSPTQLLCHVRPIAYICGILYHSRRVLGEVLGMSSEIPATAAGSHRYMCLHPLYSLLQPASPERAGSYMLVDIAPTAGEFWVRC